MLLSLSNQPSFYCILISMVKSD